MCLDRVYDAYDLFQKKIPRSGIGYKLFRVHGAKITSWNNGSYRYKPGWNTDKSSDFINYGESQAYSAGFHVFKDEGDVIAFVSKWSPSLIRKKSDNRVLKIKYADVVAVGSQDGVTVIVAKKIFIYTPLALHVVNKADKEARK